MRLINGSKWVKLGAIAGTIFLLLACGLTANLSPTPTPTKTGGGVMEITPFPITNRCDGLSGDLEMQILVGPAEAVGLEPFSVGQIPFSIVPSGEGYLIEGGGAISYEGTLEEVWGTYTVTLDMETSLTGECLGETGNEELQITAETSGEQMVEVRSEGFQGDYPWSGTQTLNLSFPLEDGAIVEGEGWIFVLHLSP